MKYYFYSFSQRDGKKETAFFNETCTVHPFEAIKQWNDINPHGERFMTLLYFTEITKEDYIFYRQNVKYI